MGWLGWEPAVAMAADINCILIAVEARIELIGMIFGDGKPKPKKGKRVTADSFRQFANRINRLRGGPNG